MKFDWKLSYSENMDAWQAHRLCTPYTRYDSLSDGEKEWLKTLNQALRQLEDKYFAILDAKCKELQGRVADQTDWLMSFNLGYQISFYLREDDPEFDDEENILMVIQSQWSTHEDAGKDWGFGATHVDHAEPCESRSGESQCYLYHRLDDHCFLDLRDLFRIGDIGVDINISEQSDTIYPHPVAELPPLPSSFFLGKF